MNVSISFNPDNEADLEAAQEMLAKITGKAAPAAPAEDPAGDEPKTRRGRPPKSEDDEPKKGKKEEDEPAEDEEETAKREEFRAAMKALKASKGTAVCQELLKKFEAELLTEVAADDLDIAIATAKKKAK